MNEETLRSMLTGRISGTVISCDDPLQQGRIQVYPDTFSYAKVPPTMAPWHTIDTGDSQSGCGGTPHSSSQLRPGHRVHSNYSKDGTGAIVTSHVQYGDDAGEGMAQAPKGDNQYPGNPSDKA